MAQGCLFYHREGDAKKMSDSMLTPIDNITIHRVGIERAAKDLLSIARKTKARESEGALMLTQAIAYISLAAEKLRAIEDRKLLS